MNIEKEKQIFNKLGKTTPFEVPNGYFEHVTSDIMQKLPNLEVYEELPVSRWTKSKPFVYMAAMFIGAALIVKVLTFTQSDNQTYSVTDANSEKIVDEVVDGVMMDDYSIYVYLTDVNNKNDN